MIKSKFFNDLWLTRPSVIWPLSVFYCSSCSYYDQFYLSGEYSYFLDFTLILFGTFFFLSSVSPTSLPTSLYLDDAYSSSGLRCHFLWKSSLTFQDRAFCSFCFLWPCCVYSYSGSYHRLFAHQFHPLDGKLCEELSEWVLSALLWTSVMTFG